MTFRTGSKSLIVLESGFFRPNLFWYRSLHPSYRSRLSLRGLGHCLGFCLRACARSMQNAYNYRVFRDFSHRL